jgi:TatA/E family protein of Tat protein translocase
MFGLGIWEVVVILAVALIVLGPRKLPEVARQIGRAMREFRRASNELRYNLDDALTPRDPPVRTENRPGPTPPLETVRTPAATLPPGSTAAAPAAAPTSPADAAATTAEPGKPDAPAG